jgi:addiction module HigA family antidote
MLNEEFLKPLGIKQKDAAEDLGISLVRLNEIIKGKRGVTPDTALRLARRFGMSGEFWLGLQADWDLYHTLHGREASAINKIRLHPELAAV